MRKPVAITPPRDRFPAQRCLLAVVSTIVSIVVVIIVLGLPGAAEARGKGKPAPINPPAVTTPVMPARATTVAAATSASLRAANDTVASKATVEAPTGSILGKVTVGKASGAATAEAVPVPLPSAVPQRPKDRYPENHSYLRPYHYKWRYWTPG
jgi:hypothetical protein